MVIIGPKHVPEEGTPFLFEEQDPLEKGYFSLRRIKNATQNFSYANKIGDGGFGSVYKGRLPNGMKIAVKRLSEESKQESLEFLNEVNATISAVRHPNLVTFLGHCLENNQFLLVYEYMENGCLQSALFGLGQTLKRRLNWPTRVKICLGIAKGLAFLHEGESMAKIVHRHIKLSNVFLDKYLNPKISDFELARHYDGQRFISRIVGTWGYLAPEYAMQGILTQKADVFSFGVVVLKLISGRHSLSDPASFIEKGDHLGFIDEDLKTNIPMKEATMVLDLALLCTNESAKLRPTMSDVVRILEGRTMLKTPRPKSHCLTGVTTERATADISVHHLGNSSTNPKVTDQENIFNPKDGVISSHAAPVEDENNTDIALHDDLVSDAKYSSGKVGDNGVSNVASREDEYNTHIECHGDFVPVRKNYKGKQREDATHIATTSDPPLRTARFSTSSIFESSTKMEDECELEYIENSFKEGKHFIQCSDEELKVGCSKWKDSLVGYLMSDNKSFNLDKAMVETLWALKGNVQMFTLGRGYFLFQFSCVEDKIRVLESSGVWHINQRPLVLRKWDWKLKLDKFEMKSLPIWVKIYNLPLFLWTSSFLSKVASGLGIPLYIDQKTKNSERLDYARLYVEVDASKPLPKSLDISVKGIDYQLRLEYDWRPLRCAKCCTFGHIESECKWKTKQAKQN